MNSNGNKGSKANWVLIIVIVIGIILVIGTLLYYFGVDVIQIINSVISGSIGISFTKWGGAIRDFLFQSRETTKRIKADAQTGKGIITDLAETSRLIEDAVGGFSRQPQEGEHVDDGTKREQLKKYLERAHQKFGMMPVISQNNDYSYLPPASYIPLKGYSARYNVKDRNRYLNAWERKCSVPDDIICARQRWQEISYEEGMGGQIEQGTKDIGRVLQFARQIRKPLMLLGGPGSGKTECLKALFREYVQDALRSIEDDKQEITKIIIPIYIDLKAFALYFIAPKWKSKWGSEGDLVDLSLFIASTWEEEYGLQYAPDLVEMLMKKGRILLLLDGLDEVEHIAPINAPTKVTRKTASRVRIVIGEISPKLDITVVLTSRWEAISRIAGEPPLIFYLEGLIPDDMRSFVTAPECKTLGLALEHYPRLQSFAATPLALVEAWKLRNKLNAYTPLDTRFELYENYVQFLLRTWKEKKSEKMEVKAFHYWIRRKEVHSSYLTAKQAELLLGHLAWYLHTQRRYSAPKNTVDGLQAIVKKVLPGIIKKRGIIAHVRDKVYKIIRYNRGQIEVKAIDDLIKRYGVLQVIPNTSRGRTNRMEIDVPEEEYGFPNIVLQEFFVAWFIVHSSDNAAIKEDIREALKKRAHTLWWEKVVLLALQMTEKEEKPKLRDDLLAMLRETVPALTGDTLHTPLILAGYGLTHNGRPTEMQKEIKKRLLGLLIEQDVPLFVRCRVASALLEACNLQFISKDGLQGIVEVSSPDYQIEDDLLQQLYSAIQRVRGQAEARARVRVPPLLLAVLLLANDDVLQWFPNFDDNTGAGVQSLLRSGITVHGPICRLLIQMPSIYREYSFTSTIIDLLKEPPKAPALGAIPGVQAYLAGNLIRLGRLDNRGDLFNLLEQSPSIDSGVRRWIATALGAIGQRNMGIADEKGDTVVSRLLGQLNEPHIGGDKADEYFRWHILTISAYRLFRNKEFLKDKFDIAGGAMDWVTLATDGVRAIFEVNEEERAESLKWMIGELIYSLQMEDAKLSPDECSWIMEDITPMVEELVISSEQEELVEGLKQRLDDLKKELLALSDGKKLLYFELRENMDYLLNRLN